MRKITDKIAKKLSEDIIVDYRVRGLQDTTDIIRKMIEWELEDNGFTIVKKKEGKKWLKSLRKQKNS